MEPQHYLANADGNRIAAVLPLDVCEVLLRPSHGRGRPNGSPLAPNESRTETATQHENTLTHQRYGLGGRRISPDDAWIAATALAHRSTQSRPTRYSSRLPPAIGGRYDLACPSAIAALSRSGDRRCAFGGSGGAAPYRRAGNSAARWATTWSISWRTAGAALSRMWKSSLVRL